MNVNVNQLLILTISISTQTQPTFLYDWKWKKRARREVKVTFPFNSHRVVPHTYICMHICTYIHWLSSCLFHFILAKETSSISSNFNGSPPIILNFDSSQFPFPNSHYTKYFITHMNILSKLCIPCAVLSYYGKCSEVKIITFIIHDHELIDWYWYYSLFMFPAHSRIMVLPLPQILFLFFV